VFTDPFGAVRSGSAVSVPGDHRFLGAVSDTASGLSLLGARYYDPGVGTFLSVDPMLDTGLPSQFNAYVYSANNPLTWSDPSGKDWNSFWGGVFNEGKKLLNAAKSWVNNNKPLIRTLTHMIIANPVVVAVTQHPGPLTKLIYYAAGFRHEKNGNYSTRADPLQLIGGYNDTYDKIFDDTCNTGKPQKFEFEYDHKKYALWAWKGDYLNLGAGGEIGFYSQDAKDADGQWDADQNGYMPKMTMNLRGPGGEQIADFAPPHAQSWVGQWNPNVQNTHPDDLAATMTVDFSGNPGLLKAFQESLQGNKNSPWSFSNGVAKLKFRRRDESSTPKLHSRRRSTW
jgi:RHS repeat-associated protein